MSFSLSNYLSDDSAAQALRRDVAAWRPTVQLVREVPVEPGVEAGEPLVRGAQHLVVVNTGELTLVMPRERAADLKKLLEKLPPELRELS